MKEDFQHKMDEMLSNIEKKKKTPKLLLHACCAPCSSYVLEYLSKYFEITLYYYNPNIAPYDEFDKRVKELERLIKEMPLEHSVNVVVEKYDNNEFNQAIKGHELDGEGSERCFKCYNLRMSKAAKYAKNNKYDYFTTTLSISPYKNSNKLNEIGSNLEKKYKIKYLYADFKKKNGYKRSIELSKEYNLYRQDYCGCVYSKKEAIERKKAKEVRSSVESIMTTKKKKNSEFNAKRSDYKGFSIIKFILAIAIVIGGLIVIDDFSKNTVETPVIDISKYNTNSDNLIDKKDNDNYIDIPLNYIVKESSLNEYYFYGNKFNLNGDIETEGFNVTDVNLILSGKHFNYSFDINYSVTSTGIHYYGGDKLNNGIDLNDVNIDEYKIYIETIVNEKSEYYSLNDKTNNNETVYYSVTNNGLNKRLTLNKKDDVLELFVINAEEELEIYDVVIDPGHGGKDEGACYNRVCEVNYTLDLSQKLKANLEAMGYRVALTRNEDIYLEKYGENGRVTRAGKTKAKLLLSIHLNSTTKAYNGFEIYTSNNIDYGFAKKFANELVSLNKLPASNNTSFRVEPGIYTRTFTSSNVRDINNEVATTYTNISTNTNYYFMIRETGGYMSGAYVDGQEGQGENPYRNSNVGIESYILELGYINNPNNVEILNANKDKYMDSVANVINMYFKG